MKSLFYLTILFLISGCAAKYVEPLATQPAAKISFEREAKSPLLGSTTIFVVLDDTFVCDAARGFMGQQKIATIDKGNPLVENQNREAIRILASNNFRLLVKNVGGYRICDVVLGFKAEAGKEYKLKAITDLKSSDTSCSAQLSEVTAGKEIDLNFVEYQECSETGTAPLIIL